MSVINVKACKCIKNALEYQQGKKKDRIACTSSNCGFFDILELSDNLKKLKNREIEAFTIVQSFPKEELSVNNPEDIEKCNRLGYKLAKRAFPNSFFIVNTHKDSKGQCLHNHIVVLNDDMQTGLALQKNTFFYSLKRINDEIMRENHMEVCEPAPEHLDQMEYWEKKRGNKRTWQDELKEKIDEARKKATSLKDFGQKLSNLGVEARLFKANGEPLKHFSFSFTDKSGKQHKKRDEKLGTAYTKDNLLKQFSMNYMQATGICSGISYTNTGYEYEF